MEPTRRGQDRLPGASEGSMLIGWSARSSYQAVIANSRGWPWRPSDWEQGEVVHISGAMRRLSRQHERPISEQDDRA